jgi:hypothetical protein
VCFLGLLLWAELPHAFISFLNALLPDVEVASLWLEGIVHMQFFTACAGISSDHFSSFDLRVACLGRISQAEFLSLPSSGPIPCKGGHIHPSA